MTPEIAVAAAKNSHVLFTVLVEHFGSVPVTDEVWKEAAAAQALLLERYAKSMPELRTLLDIAATSGTRSVVRLLLARGGLDPEKGIGRSWHDMAQLMWATFEGDEEKVVELLMAGVPPGVRDERTGWTPLWVAARMGWRNIVRILLGTGRVDVDAKLVAGGEKMLLWTSVVSGETALWTAAQIRHDYIVRLLLEKGADIHVRNYNGESMMDVAEKNNYEFVAEVLRDWEQTHKRSSSAVG